MATEKKIASQILGRNGQTYSLVEVAGRLKKITKIENQIIIARNNQSCFSEYSEADQILIIRDVVTEATSAYGFRLPEGDKHLDSIIRSVRNMILIHGFDVLSEREMILAIHANHIPPDKQPAAVEFSTENPTGVYFNAHFYNKMLRNYFRMRELLDEKIQNLLNGSHD